MSIELIQAAQQALSALEKSQPHPSNPVIGLTNQDFIDHEETIRQLRTQLQQPATGEPVRGVIGMGAHALAGELAQAVAQDDADPEGHDMSAGLFGPNVSAWLRKVAYYAGKQPATGEPVASRNPFASRCYAMSESHLSGHRLIVGFEKLGDVQDAHEWVARQGRGDFTHPATGEPDEWKLVPIVPTEKMLLAYTGGAVTNAGFRWCRHQWSAMLAAAPAAHPAPSVLKDDQIAALVNKVRDIARMFHDHQSLRERIAIELVPVLKAKKETP